MRTKFRNCLLWGGGVLLLCLFFAASIMGIGSEAASWWAGVTGGAFGAGVLLWLTEPAPVAPE